MPPSNPILLPWEILITLALLGTSVLLFSKVIGIDFVKNHLRQNSVHRKTSVALLGIIIGVCSFVINISFISRTSKYNPPHGVEFGAWDVNPEMEQFGGVAFVYGNEYLPIDTADSALNFISNERFKRYLRPPILRQKCYTENKVGCTWADVDIANYEEVLQWLDYLIQIGIAVLAGFLGSEIMSWQMKKKNFFQEPEMG